MKTRGKSGNNSMTVRLDDLLQFEPVTNNQDIAYKAWDEGDNLVLSGSAGTGKTFIGMYLALEDILDKDTEYDKLFIIRSMVPTRDMGYLPGSKEEKEQAYILPYKAIANEFFGDVASYNKMVTSKQIEFMSTSFIRGSTFDNCIMLVDEILGVGDFKFREKSRKKMIELIKSDITVVLVSHDSETIKEYSNKCIWIHEGELKAAGETDEMMKLYLDS